jgi:hypothetical protein
VLKRGFVLLTMSVLVAVLDQLNQRFSQRRCDHGLSRRRENGGNNQRGRFFSFLRSAGCGSGHAQSAVFTATLRSRLKRSTGDRENGGTTNEKILLSPFSLLISKSRSRRDSEDCSTDPKRVEPIGRLTTHCGYEGSRVEAWICLVDDECPDTGDKQRTRNELRAEGGSHSTAGQIRAAVSFVSGASRRAGHAP